MLSDLRLLAARHRALKKRFEKLEPLLERTSQEVKKAGIARKAATRRTQPAPRRKAKPGTGSAPKFPS